MFEQRLDKSGNRALIDKSITGMPAMVRAHSLIRFFLREFAHLHQTVPV